jgi:hypothetical protein
LLLWLTASSWNDVFENSPVAGSTLMASMLANQRAVLES